MVAIVDDRKSETELLHQAQTRLGIGILGDANDADIRPTLPQLRELGQRAQARLAVLGEEVDNHEPTAHQFVELPDLRKYAQLERMDVRVIPRAMGEFVVGVVATSLGGAAAATGIVLSAAGCGRGGGMCTAGLINLPVGAAVVGGGTLMIVDSSGQINVTASGQAGIGQNLQPLH